MGFFPPSGCDIRTVGFSEFCEVNGQSFKRRKGAQQWTEVERSDIPAGHSNIQLSLVRHNQAPGEPCHWALLVACENEPGMVYEVTGDAECMSYVSSPDPVQVLEMDSFKDIYFVADLTNDQAATVKQTAENEPPPRAPSRKDVKENCQYWAIRVLARLAEHGIVDIAKVEQLRSMTEPI